MVDTAALGITLRLADDASVALIRSAAALGDAQCRAASRLPGWSRGHLLTHVARNADALGKLLTGARTGRAVPMYASTAARENDIEAGAQRSADELLADLRASTARLQEAAEALGPGQSTWQTVVEWRRGRSRPVSDVPRARLTEVALHHVDLDVGYELADLPEPVADAIVAESLARLDSLPSSPALLVRSTAGGPIGRTTGTSDAAALTVDGNRADLVGWLTGRTDGAGLVADRSLQPLPEWS